MGIDALRELGGGAMVPRGPWRAACLVLAATFFAGCDSPRGASETAAPASSSTAPSATPGAQPTPVEEVTKPLGELTPIGIDELLAKIQAESGKVVLINFWATWCVPCVEEMPELIKIYESYREHPGFAFISVSADGSDWIDDKLRPFATKFGIPFQVYVIDNAETPEEFERLATGVSTPDWGGDLPLTVLFDAKGNKLQSWGTATSEEALREALSQAGVAAPSAS